MTKAEKKQLARKFGSKTGKPKKKHIMKAKLAIRGLMLSNFFGAAVNNQSLTEAELKELLNG